MKMFVLKPKNLKFFAKTPSCMKLGQLHQGCIVRITRVKTTKDGEKYARFYIISSTRTFYKQRFQYITSLE